jgi:hypothetical protein
VAIAFVTVGTALSGNAGTTTVTITYPASLVVGNMVLTGRTVKPETATAVDEAGWTAVANATGGTGTTNIDTGPTRGKVDYRTVAGGEGASVVFDQGSTPNSVSGCMIQYSKAPLTTWDVVATTGNDATFGTGRSATGSAISLRAGDVIVAFVHSDTDTTTAFTSPTIAATGMTITTTQRLAPSGSSQNNDSGLCIFDGFITAGTEASVAPSLTLTAGPSNSGSTSFVRLREVPFPVVPITAPSIVAPWP